MTRWLGRMFPALVLFAAAAIYWGKVAQRTASRPTDAPERKPTVVGLPPVRVQMGTKATGNPRDAESIRARFETILHGVDTLADGDQNGLDRQFETARRAILGHEAELVDYYRDQLTQLDRMPLKRSFFLTKALIDFVPESSPALRDLFQTEPLRDLGGDPHDGPSQLNLVKSFALQKLGEMPGAARDRFRSLLPSLIDLAKHEPDLAIAREALVTITRLKLSDDPVTLKRDVLRARRAEEHRAFESI